jgi:hypothetical protein
VPNNPPIEDQILIDLFHWRHTSRDQAKQLTAYLDHPQIIAELVRRGDVQHLGSGFFRITPQGQKTITDKYPELWD